MKHLQFSKKRLAVYISAILATGTSSGVLAEEATEVKKDNVEVIEVQGIKGSLVRSMNVKRDMSGVVDAISAEEMGKFPDTNLAESLQRITGVTVSRSNGEGSQITVRGFGPDFNLVTLNGRQMPGTGNSRSYSFENLSSDGVSALEVYKTARAENPTGGLGATVNIVTSKPLASPGEKMSLSAKAIHDTSNEEGDDVTPEFSAVYSNTFADDSFGIGFSFNHHRRDFQQQSASIQGWQANVDLPSNLDDSKVIDPRPLDEEGNRIGNHFFPRDMNYGIGNFQRERTNGHVVVQYAPIDNLIISADYTGTKAVTGMNSIGWGMWNDYGGNINGYELDENGTVVYADISGNDGSYSASRATTEVEEQSFGLNIDWQVSDTLFLTLDYHDSSSETDNGADKGLGSHGTLVLGSDQLNTKIYDYRTGEIPHGEILWKNGTNELAPSEIDSHFSQFIHSPGKSTVEQLQVDGVWENDLVDIGLVDVKFGVARTEQEMGGSHAWSGLIGGFLFNPSWPEIFPDGMFTRNDTGDFLDAFDGGGAQLNPHYYYTFDFDEAVARSEAFLTNEVLGGNDYFATTAYHDMGTFSQGSVNEDTTSVYIDTSWEFDIADFPVQINAGLRYEQTDVTSQVLQPVPTSVWWKGGSEWHTQYLPGENNFLTMEGEHDVFLPMLDLRVDLTDDIVGRVSWGKTISRAPLGSLAGGRSLSGSPKIGSRNGGEGNTNLQPFESTNFDLSLEYYYGEGSYAAVGFFNKDVENFIGSQITSSTIDGFRDIYQGPRWQQAVSDIEARGDQATNDAIFAQIQANGSALNDEGYLEPTAEDPLMVWDITRPFNAPDTKTVNGFEVALQHLIGDSGFGVGVNATFVDGDVEFDVDSLSQQTPLTGLSDSANFQAFYEKHGLSVKVTYAWRDEYLIGVGQSQGSSDNPPQFAKEFGQWDMSVNYDVTERFTVFFEGINLNNETEQGFGRYEEQFLFAREYGPRYALGVRYSFN
ncbi:TonB-dependent receptor [Litorilituus lipolyticus]|uniref:TonB-dependent receptor n=1 Tax=Litorilituus lipolyticus TaxID=2491017 RepID=A0A502KPK2_9GAMM|nr:TonB-dependent receptor [Litorilituus lipolyticus]TPH12135.1 TonB-dependent receptor [Litorilituus lipolyticus]